MARSRAGAKPSISLFPFLSVLAAVMGTLALVIIGMTLLSLQSSAQVVELTPTGSRKTPVYVECRQEGLLVHPEGIQIPADGLERADGPWASRVAEIAGDAGRQYVVFLVRPNGIDTFWKARAAVRDEKIDVGYDPVYAGGRIEFQQAGGSLRTAGSTTP
jgi:hypothetical protein